MRLQGKVAIVTGAGSGIGQGIARRYAEEGARVAFADLADSAVVSELEAQGLEALAVRVNVTDPVSAGRMIDLAVERFGRLDILVTCAGINKVQSSADMPPQDWARILDVNLNGLFYCCQAAGRQMIRQGGGGKIINMSSGYGLAAAPDRAAYCSSKAAVIMLTKVLAVEWAKHRINVNALAPGYTMTKMVKKILAEGVLDGEAIKRRTPLGRFCEISDIANLAVFLASEEASFITGETVTIDGGWCAYGYL